VRGVQFSYGSSEELAADIDASSDDHGIALSCTDGLRDGEWVLVSFSIEDENLSVAGRVTLRGDDTRLIFEERDWLRLCEFAGADGCSCADRQSMQLPACSVHPPPNSRVLVVDDDPDLQQVMRCMLRANGFEVTTVSTAEEAFSYVRGLDVDLLVLDCNLPGMSGLEFVRRIRCEPCCGRLPVLFLTAHCSPDDVAEAFSAGADDFVGKPFRAPELGARIIGLLRRSNPPEMAEQS
jgi:two-component system phosphate regulon response regulator PhoB